MCILQSTVLDHEHMPDDVTNVTAGQVGGGEGSSSNHTQAQYKTIMRNVKTPLQNQPVLPNQLKKKLIF